VEELVFVSNGVQGRLPESLTALTRLRVVELSPAAGYNWNYDAGCRDNGPAQNDIPEVPPFLGTMSSLERLVLHCVNLSGPIPPELAALPRLETLALS
jgi:hypothetical protein